jgi:hypothetical protein
MTPPTVTWIAPVPQCARATSTEGTFMRATVIHGAGDVRVENVPDPGLREPTDAMVRVASGYKAMADRTALKVLVQP